MTGPDLPPFPGEPPHPATSAYPAMPPPPESFADDAWRRLDGRTVLTYPFAQGGPLIFVLLIAALVGGRLEELVIRLVVTVGLLAAFGGLHFWRFRYRLVDGRLETRSGLISRKSKVINVDRIRGVDIEAKLAHRIAGVCALRIEHPGAAGGSRGRNRNGRDRIDAVSHAEGERLRNVLLHERAEATSRATSTSRSDGTTGQPIGPATGQPHGLAAGRPIGQPHGQAPGHTVSHTTGQSPDYARDTDRTLLRMPPRWLLYAPFSIRLLLLGPAALLGVFNSLRDADVRSGRDVTALAGGAGWPVLAVIAVVVLIITAMLSGVVTYWRWTVTTRGHDIVLTRGLLTRRTVAIERRRLRGVMVREPLAGRPFRAATLQVVLSGVTGSVRSALVPLGPQPALERFGREFVQPCRSPVREHPRGAYRRRLRRSLIPAVALAVAAIITLAWSAGIAAAILAALAALAAVGGVVWARASYRTLGHAIDPDVLFARHGVIVRHSETVGRDEPIGLRVRQSVFARRAGVASMDVALVARGFTRISDMDAADIEPLAVALLGPLGAPPRPESWPG